tara:strand:- start:17165 stop:18376 length:1212 start_codon:yes stop_codon:yes gene_type:complete
MANTIITPSIIAKVGLAQLENNLVMGKKVYRDYTREFVKVGDTISVRRPVKFVANDGAVAINQDVVEGKFSLAMDARKHVSWSFSTQDLTLSIEEYNERYIKPAAIALANQIDYDLCGLYNKVWNWVGTPASPVNSFSDFALAPRRLDEGAVPQDMRSAVLSPADAWGLVGSQTALYMQDVARGAYRAGDIGNIAGVSTAMDQNIRMHTNGAAAGGGLINGANQNVTYATSKDTNTQSLITDDWTASTTFKAGDVFTIADVYAVNPVSKQSTGVLQQFVIQANITATGTDCTLSIAPAIITSGPYQTVDSVPANDAAITMVGTGSTQYAQNLVFHKNAFALVMADLEMPDGAVFKARESHNGYSMRVIKYYDGEMDEDKIRLDVLYGVKAIYPDLACRLSGTT